MENFNLKKFLVENKLTTNSKMFNENEAEAPRTITVKVTEKGKTAMKLYTGPSQIQMNGGSDSNYYYIGNEEPQLGKETNIYFATYLDDIQEIQILCLAVPLGSNKWDELVDHRSLNSNQIKNLPSDIRKIPDGYHIFRQGEYAKTKGIVVGGTDHRGYFEIVSIP